MAEISLTDKLCEVLQRHTGKGPIVDYRVESVTDTVPMTSTCKGRDLQTTLTVTVTVLHSAEEL